MAVHYLIDGYNLLYALPEIPPGSWQDKRAALLKLLQSRRPQGNNPLSVIFDSREGGGNTLHDRGFTVIYTAGESADDWIATYVRAAENPRILVVVSNDKGIRDQVRGTGARFISVAEFLKSPQNVKKTSSEPQRDPSENAEITEEFKQKWL